VDYFDAEKRINKLLEKYSSDILQKIIDFIYENFEKYNWIGIYVVKENNLILGLWNGKQATKHTKIPIEKGICGSAAKTGKTELVSDVKKDDRYLTCFITTKSEIVVPIKKNGEIIGEIDIDSDRIDAFDENDRKFLEKLCANGLFINLILQV